MKKTILITSLLAASVSAFAADGFIIKGNIPGMPSGTAVSLYSHDGDKTLIAETSVSGDSFTLSGSVESPTICEIRFEVPDSENVQKAIGLMVENVEISVSAPDFSKVAPGFYVGTEGLEMERGVTVKGGRAQDEYAEFNEALYPYEFSVKDAHYKLYWTEEGKKEGPVQDGYAKAYSEALRARNKATDEFVMSHPTYSICGKLIGEMLRTPFSYSESELDEIAKAVSGMWDKARLAKVNEAVGKSREYPRLTRYTDFVALDADGAERKLSSLLEDGKYTLVDFWASWCGPCRAAIPHVKELHQKYADRLNVVSVSLDSDEKPWRKAMEKEQMAWKQLWADKDRVKGVTEPYQVKGIPFLMVLDPEGKIAFAGHGPDDLSEFLVKTLE